MKQRILTGIGIALIAIPILIFSGYIIYPIALSLLAVTALFEVYRVIGQQNNLYLTVPAYAVAAVFPVLTFYLFAKGEYTYPFILYILAVVLFAYLFYLFSLGILQTEKVKLADITQVFTLTLYVILSFTSLSAIRYFPAGGYLLGIVLLCAWGTDVCAYFVGYFLGKHKLSPKISPKKTVEGSVGGIVGALLLCLLYGFILERFALADVNYLALALTGLLLSVVAQIGDLAASLIKREYGVKDYSNLMPGHGGIMDRFDSMIAVATFLVILSLAYPPLK